ncbi:MAG: beta-ketoacyl-[acyl-carrier-protein] synthase family protein, partial [Bacteroidota bacterium]
MQRRVVITGLGVCAPNGIGLSDFGNALSEGKSGIRFHEELERLNFGCQIAGNPLIESIDLNKYFTNIQLRGLEATGLIYGVIAGKDAWEDAGLDIAPPDSPNWENGVVFGTGMLGVDRFRNAIYAVDEGNVRRSGSTTVIQTMASGISAFLGGMLGCGNQVTTNSSACSTGTEALLMGYERIKSGQAKRMLVGSCSDSGPYIWGGFDAMRILPRNHNDKPELASRPLSASATGFVPGSGAGALVLESLDSALERGAHIYAEVLGGSINSGGHRGGGSMTAPNSSAVQQCIIQAIKNSNLTAKAVDAINGHLTATTKDPVEVQNWSIALSRRGADFPYINSFKGMFGHCLAAAGSIECVGTVLQFEKNQIFGNVNCEDIHPEVLKIVDISRVPRKSFNYEPK